MQDDALRPALRALARADKPFIAWRTGAGNCAGSGFGYYVLTEPGSEELSEALKKERLTAQNVTLPGEARRQKEEQLRRLTDAAVKARVLENGNSGKMPVDRHTCAVLRSLYKTLAPSRRRESICVHVYAFLAPLSSRDAALVCQLFPLLTDGTVYSTIYTTKEELTI